jgi:hypothetical protein
MRAMGLMIVAAVLLTACATQPNMNVGGNSDTRTLKGTAGVGWKF